MAPVFSDRLMDIIGTQDSFALTIHHADGAAVAVEIWAGGECLTPTDIHPYLPSFLHRLRRDEDRLVEPDQYLRFQPALQGLTAEAAFELVASQDIPEMWAALRFLDWGPTTDQVTCFLLPMERALLLAWSLHTPPRPTGPVIRAIPIQADQLAHTLALARQRLSGPQP